MPLKVSYDPGRPNRTWVTDLGGDRGDDMLYGLSGSTCCLQIFCLPVSVGLAAVGRRATGGWRYWPGAHYALPCLLQAGCLFLAQFTIGF
jgi:hypothetical protein